MCRLFAVLILLISTSPAFAEQLSVELACNVTGNFMKKDWRDKYVSVEAFERDAIHISIKDSQLIPENDNGRIDLTVTKKNIKLPEGFVYEFSNLAVTELEIDRYTGAITLKAISTDTKDDVYLIITGKCGKTVAKKRLF